MKPLVLIDPWPRTKAMIFTDRTWDDLHRRCEVVAHFDGGRMPDAVLDGHLETASIIIGQPDLDRSRIERARNLKAVINVKGNWEPSLDYAAAQARGIYVLSIAPIMAPAVAEWCLGAAIDLGRGITLADREFRAGTERYGFAGNAHAKSLFGARFGLVGFGNLGRSLVPLLRAFDGTIQVYDPWLPEGYLRAQKLEPMPVETLLATSDFVFILAGVTIENQGFLDRRQLETIKQDASVVLASRAEVVDFEAFVELAEGGRFRAAIDVFPEEPVPERHPVRGTRRILLSAHRAGGIAASYRRLAEWMMDDLRQILEGLPPVRLQRAEPGLASIMRSR